MHGTHTADAKDRASAAARVRHRQPVVNRAWWPGRSASRPRVLPPLGQHRHLIEARCASEGWRLFPAARVRGIATELLPLALVDEERPRNHFGCAAVRQYDWGGWIRTTDLLINSKARGWLESGALPVVPCEIRTDAGMRPEIPARCRVETVAETVAAINACRNPLPASTGRVAARQDDGISETAGAARRCYHRCFLPVMPDLPAAEEAPELAPCGSPCLATRCLCRG